MTRTPERIVCLSAEAADWLWRIQAWDQVVGVSAYFNMPPDVLPKARVSGFSTARLDEIAALNPDLIITFSDVQAPVAAELVRRGFPVLATNQRTLVEIEATLTLLARIVDRRMEAEPWLREFRNRLMAHPQPVQQTRVYFEEWNDPLVAGIAWIGELIERAGGIDVFASLRTRRAAAERVVQPEQICATNPEAIFVSWCGKPLKMETLVSRPGWDQISAVRHSRIHELPAEDILQPGFRLVYGFERIKQHLQAAVLT